MASGDPYRPYKLEHFGRYPATETMPGMVDISGYIETIDKFSNEGNGIVPSAIIMLDSRDGEFMTEKTGGATPLLQQYDLVRLTITDSDSTSYEKFMIIDDISPQENESGRHVVLELLGRERFLQKMYMTGYYPFYKFSDIIKFIKNYYNNNKGANQPFLVFHQADLDALPSYAYGTFDFGDNTTVFDALQDIVRRLGLPVAAGGAGERYSIIVDSMTDLGGDGNNAFRAMVLRIVPRGSLGTIKTIEKPMNLTRTKSPEKGNIVVVQGQPGTGSYPKEIAEFRGLIEEYENIPQYVQSVNYTHGAIARIGNNVYQLTGTDNAGSPSSPEAAANWNRLYFSQYVAIYKKWRNGESDFSTIPTDNDSQDFQYSPWTQDKSSLWQNWGGTSAMGFPDSNLVVRESATDGTNEQSVWRDWVDFKSTDGTIPNEFGAIYDGMRVLVNGTGTGAFAGMDEFNKSYSNSMVMRWNKKWIVFREAKQFDECSVLNELKVYQFNKAPTSANNIIAPFFEWLGFGIVSDVQWRDISDAMHSNDCFHYPSAMRNIEGLIGDNTENISFAYRDTSSFTSRKYTTNSAIYIEYQHGIRDAGIQDIANQFSPIDRASEIWNGVVNLFDWLHGSPILPVIEQTSGVTPKELSDDAKNYLKTKDMYNNGWWCTLFEAPFPKSTHRGITESVGDLYKGGTFSLYNLNETPSGKRGYKANDAEELGQFDGIAFLFNFGIRHMPLRDFLGNIPFRVVMYDIFGGVWKYDFMIRFQNETQFIRIPFNNFSSYRARLPVAFAVWNWIHRVIGPELRDISVFDRHFMKRIVLHCLFPYDDQGRYDPFKLDAVVYNILDAISGSDNVIYQGIIDAFHFTKTPVAIERHNTQERHIMESPKKYPNISNVIQLQKIAKSELDIARHQDDVVEFQIENQEGGANAILPCSIQAEQFIFVKDKEFITESEDNNIAGTRKYIVDKVTYSVGDRRTNSSLVATIKASRRIGDP